MFDWDQENIRHITRHGVTPPEAEQVVQNDPVDLQFETRNGEERIAQVGETEAGRILVVVTTTRGERTRVITAFPAKGRVRNVYNATKGGSHERRTEETDLPQ